MRPGGRTDGCLLEPWILTICHSGWYGSIEDWDNGTTDNGKTYHPHRLHPDPREPRRLTSGGRLTI